MWNRGWRFNRIASFGQRRYPREQLWLNMITNSLRVIRLTSAYFALRLVLAIYQINFRPCSWTRSLVICIWNLQFIELKLKWPISPCESNSITNFWLKWFWWTNFFFVLLLLQNPPSHHKIWFLFCCSWYRISRWSWRLWNDRRPTLAEIARNCRCFLIKLN